MIINLLTDGWNLNLARKPLAFGELIVLRNTREFKHGTNETTYFHVTTYYTAGRSLLRALDSRDNKEMPHFDFDLCVSYRTTGAPDLEKLDADVMAFLTEFNSTSYKLPKSKDEKKSSHNAFIYFMDAAVLLPSGKMFNLIPIGVDGFPEWTEYTKELTGKDQLLAVVDFGVGKFNPTKENESAFMRKYTAMPVISNNS